MSYSTLTAIRGALKRPRLALSFAALLLAAPASAQHSVNPTLTYQASINREGAMTLTARLYSDPAGMDLVWEEVSKITAVGGVISLELGSHTLLPIDRLDDGLYLGISLDDGEELRPLTKLTASPMALSVPDGAVTKSKIGANFIESITINGRKVEGHGAAIKIETGNGITAGYDEASHTILLAAASSRGKGMNGTLADETIDGNLTVNGNTNLGGNATSPLIYFNAKAATALDMNGNDLSNIDEIAVGTSISLSDATSTISLNGSTGTTGQVLTSQGASSTPIWSWPKNSWGRSGDAGTSAGSDFLGTSDDQPFEIHVHHDGASSEGRQRALRLEPTDQSPNVILGYNQNAVDAGYIGGTIAGGGEEGYANNVIRDYGTISGGRANTAGLFATISGGEYNEATNTYATVGGGYYNRSTNTNSTTAGGYMNWARGNGAYVGGGEENTARGNLAVIGGGYFNRAISASSTIAGGENNTTESTFATIGGGNYNYADGYGSTVAGGENNYASGLEAVVSGGDYNYAWGHYSAIAGGRYLMLGGHSFGYNGDNSGTTTDLSAVNEKAYFGNVDLMIGNVDNSARALRFYAPNTAYDYSSSYYTSFKAPTLSADIEYVLPSSQGSNTSVLQNDGSGNLHWQVLSLNGDVTGLLGSTVVQSVGGQSSSSIATATIAANSATSINTSGTIVRRDASGNFTAGTITAAFVGTLTGNVTGTLTGNVNGNVSGNAGTVTNGVYTTGSYADPAWITSLSASKITGLQQSDSVRAAYKADIATLAVSATNASTAMTAVSATNATSAVSALNFSGNLGGDVTGTQSATAVASVGGVSAANIAAGANLANAASSSNTSSTIVRRDANGDIAVGSLSASDGIVVTGGTLRVSTSSVSSSNAGITLPGNATVVQITSGATSNFNYSFPSGSEGQLLYVYNGSSRRANNAISNIDAGELATFLYIGGSWRRSS
jgi:hypothetical protein